MFDKKKLNFWRLSIIFLALTVIVLTILWSAPKDLQAQMMNATMGNMMKQMHLSGLSIYDLFSNESMQSNNQTQNQMQSNAGSESSHHQGSEGLSGLYYLTTAVIFLLLPLIIGGVIILAIVWIRI